MGNYRLSRKISVFETSLQRLARMLSSKWDIKVVFKGDLAHTDGKTITLPVIPQNADSKFLKVMEGLLDHEAAHVIDSDFAVYKQVSTKEDSSYTLNWLEDIRIEPRMIKRYPGCASNLKAYLDWATEAMMKPNKDGKIPWNETPDYKKYLTGLLVHARTDYDQGHPFFQKIDPVLRDKIFAKKDFLKSVEKCEETSELLPLVAQLIREEGMADRDIPPQEQNSQSQKSQASSENKQGSGVVGDSSGPLSVSGMIKEQIEELRKESSSVEYAAYTTEGDQEVTAIPGDKAKYKQYHEEISGSVYVAKKKLVSALLTQRESSWESGKRRGRVDSRGLHRLVANTSKSIFKQECPELALDTCLLMMTDHSGSTNGHVRDLMSKTIILLSEVAQMAGIPFSILGFTTGDSGKSYSRLGSASPQEQKLYTRWGDHRLIVYKDFPEYWSQVNHRVVNMGEYNGINTLDGESLREGGRRLFNRPEKRKILFWFNDGAPCGNGGDNQQALVEYTKKSAKDVEGECEVIAFGIKTDAVKQFFKNYVVINEVEDIPKITLGKLDELLRMGKINSLKQYG